MNITLIEALKSEDTKVGLFRIFGFKKPLFIIKIFSFYRNDSFDITAESFQILFNMKRKTLFKKFGCLPIRPENVSPEEYFNFIKGLLFFHKKLIPQFFRTM